MKITGDRRHRQRIQRLRGRALVSELGKQVKVGAMKVEGEAQYLIAKGSIQGKGHLPSKPGEPPNKDTGALTEGIKWRQTGPLSAVVESSAKSKDGAPYAVILEYGGAKIAERPYMRPAAKTVHESYAINVRSAVNTVIRKG